MNRFLLVVLPLALLLPSCVTHSIEVRVGVADYEVARREREDGSVDRYVIDVRGLGRAALRIHTERDRKRPFLGFQVVELGKAEASRRGVRPYSGLLVRDTYPDSGARRGGIHAGDVLLALDERPMIYLSDLADFEAGLSEGQEIKARVLRGVDEIELPMRAHVIEERVTERESIRLETARPRKAYAGVTLGGIPSVWCEQIYDRPREAVVITSVEVGSPAWLAGLRAGDVIDRIDGRPVPPVGELVEQIAARGVEESSMRFAVSRGPGETFETEVELHDYRGKTSLYIPLVLDAENGVYRDRLTLGPFGLLMSTSNSYVADATTREVETSSFFSLLFGLFRVESSPDETEVTLLWFIEFET